MDEILDKLERDVETSLALLGPQLAVRPPAGVLARAAAAAQMTLNEQWFGGHETPAPSDETIMRVRSAVREALGGARDPQHEEANTLPFGSRLNMRNAARARLWSSLAAAAMIGICFGVIRFSPSLKSPVSIAEYALGRFVEAGSDVYADEPLTASIRDDLSSVEESITQWQPDRDRVEDGLDNIGDDIDDLFNEPDVGTGTS